MNAYAAIILTALCFGFSLSIFDTHFDEYESCVSGRSQSPVDINTTTALFDAQKADVRFEWTNCSTPSSVLFRNDGETAYMASMHFEQTTFLNHSKYLLRQVNFHWSQPFNHNSEHSIDACHYDGEIEFIHTPEGFDHAGDPFGQAMVVSLLLQVDSERDKDVEEITHFADNLPAIIEAESQEEVSMSNKTLFLQRLLPTSRDFFRYSGSLTVTPCYENIERIVFREPLTVTSEFFDKLRELKGKDGNLLLEAKNRDTQSLNGRTIYKSF